MSREVDRRNFTQNKVPSSRENALRALADDATKSLPGNQSIRITKFDSTTGSASRIVSDGGSAEQGNHIQRALDHAKKIRKAFGFAPGQPGEFEADPHVSATSAGARVVHLHQLYKGIPIFQANLAIHFNPNDLLQETEGSTIEVSQDISAIPKLTVEEATLKAAQFVTTPEKKQEVRRDPFGGTMKRPVLNISGFNPKVIAAFENRPDVPTVLEAGPFQDEIKASLTWFPLDNDLRLTWEVILALPSYAEMYRVLVDSENGDILYSHQMTKMIAACGSVYLADGKAERKLQKFPIPLEEYGLPIPKTLPKAFPGSWVEKELTEGNCVTARLGERGKSLTGTLKDGLVTFNPADPTGDDQKVLNIFYYNCYMHDFFYLLGFTEEFGNFQKVNFYEKGLAKDPVDARSYPEEVYGTANMSTPIDGRSPVMNMGLVRDTERHTAFDSSVVFHEYMHGVTNRLVGGGMDDRALESPQSGGMGEGWGDYIACTINNTTTVGSWVIDNPAGIRGFPYDEKFPDHFGMIGTGRYDEVHNLGEIWCATLMQMNRNVGKLLALQLVVDALKLSRSNPGFLDMRDSILKALEDMKTKGSLDQANYDRAKEGIWKAFAKFGMGPNARSHGAQLYGIEADFNVPKAA